MMVIVCIDPSIYCCECSFPDARNDPGQNAGSKSDVFPHHHWFWNNNSGEFSPYLLNVRMLTGIECTAFIQNYKQMIVLRVLLGIFQSAIFPGLSYLISTWYTRREQQLRYAFLQSGEVTIVGLGAFLNYGLNHLDRKAGLRGWRWMFLVQGLLAIGKDGLENDL